MAIKPIRVRSGIGTGQVIPQLHGYEGAAQTFKSGAPLVISSGTLIEASADVITAVGFANTPATGTTNQDLIYIPALPGTVIEVNLDDALDATNAPLTHVLAIADMWGKYALVKDAATGNWYLDQDDTTNHCAIVVAPVDAIGTVAGRVIAVLLNDATAFAG